LRFRAESWHNQCCSALDSKMRQLSHSFNTFLLVQCALAYPTLDGSTVPSSIPSRPASPQDLGLGVVLYGLVNGLGSIVSGLGTGLGATLDCTLGALLGGCSSTTEPSGALGGAVEGVVGELGDIVSGLGSGLGNTVDGIQNPLLGVDSGKPSRGKGHYRRNASPEPQGGLGGVLGGLLGGLGGVVGGLGTALGNTLGGTLAPLLGASSPAKPPAPAPAPAPLPRPRPRPEPEPERPRPRPEPERPRPRPDWERPDRDRPDRDRPEPEPERERPDVKRASASVTTKGNEVYCRKFPDTLVTDPQSLQVFQSATTLKIKCWSKPSIEGNSGRINGENVWLQSTDGCFINKSEVRERDRYEEILNQCPDTQHWVGTLQTQYTRTDCYDCPSLDCPSKDVGVAPYVDLSCYVKGENVRDQSVWLKSSAFSCYLPSGVFNQNGWLGKAGPTC